MWTNKVKEYVSKCVEFTCQWPYDNNRKSIIPNWRRPRWRRVPSRYIHSLKTYNNRNVVDKIQLSILSPNQGTYIHTKKDFRVDMIGWKWHIATLLARVWLSHPLIHHGRHWALFVEWNHGKKRNTAGAKTFLGATGPVAGWAGTRREEMNIIIFCQF